MPTWVRASADTMPLVTVWPTPNGLPMASTRSPTSRSSESPKLERRQIFVLAGIDLEDGEIGALVGEQELGFEFAPVGEHDADVGAAQDHMVVGDDETLADRR